MASPEAASSILVVEDDPELRLTIEWTLADEGLPTTAAADGRLALEWLKANRPSLVVLDIGLPIVDGYGVAAGLHELYGDTVPIVVVTADGHAPEKARRVGAIDWTHKPFDVDEFIGKIRRALRAGGAS